MIVGSTAVICAIAFYLLSYQAQQSLRDLRLSGAAFSQLLAEVPLAELQSGLDGSGPLQAFRLGQKPGWFAYALVTNESGEILNVLTAPGLDLSALESFLPESADPWSSERSVNLPGSPESILEFYSPIGEGSEVRGAVRIGYRMPSLYFTAEQLPGLALVALLIFLLTPFFYLAARRENRPIKLCADEISAQIEDGDFRNSSIKATGELHEFVERLNQFSDLAKSRIDILKQENKEAAASQKLLGYRKSRIEAVLSAMPEAIMILGEDGSVSYANEKVAQLLGANPAEIMHRRPSEWCVNEEVLEYLSRFETKETANLFTDTIRLQDTRAAERKFSINAYPLYSPQEPGAIFGRLIILRDATKEVLAEEGRNNFVAHVAHELKSPLNTLGLYAEALMADEDGDEALRIEATNVIHDEVERLAALVDNLLNISKLEMGSLHVDKHRIRLQDLLRDAFAHVTKSGREKNLRFQLDLPPELSAVAVDKELLRIAVNNLLTNAIKYTPAGGSVSLSATETEGSIQICVTDTGIGIDVDEQGKVFDKFFRSSTKEVTEIGGHGLGLPLAKEIVELHRGEIHVQSELGRGTAFTIELWKDSGLLQQAI